MLRNKFDKKSIEVPLGIPRTRISDCSRIIFTENKTGFYPINLVHQYYPDYNLPVLKRNKYRIILDQDKYFDLDIGTKKINSLVYKICESLVKIYPGENWNWMFLYEIVLLKNGTGYLGIETIN